MDRIQALDTKILQLQHMKEQAETKLARALLKKVQAILGKDTDVNLVTVLLEETWNKATTESKEVWRHKADTFCNHRIKKTAKTI